MLAAAVYIWGDGVLRPEPRHAQAVADALREGQRVWLAEPSGRSKKSHDHEFGHIAEAWRNLPEHLQDMPYALNADTLRKHALIATQHCDVETVLCGSAAAAERVAASMAPLARKAHGYALVTTQGSSVQVLTPHSQSRNAMGAPMFQQSKTDILNWLADLLSVNADDLARAESA